MDVQRQFLVFVRSHSQKGPAATWTRGQNGTNLGGVPLNSDPYNGNVSMAPETYGVEGLKVNRQPSATHTIGFRRGQSLAMTRKGIGNLTDLEQLSLLPFCSTSQPCGKTPILIPRQKLSARAQNTPPSQ